MRHFIYCVLALFLAQNASAQFVGAMEQQYPQYYVGANYTYSTYSMADILGQPGDTYFEDSYSEFGLHGGVRLTRHVGLEAGISQSSEEEKTAVLFGQPTRFTSQFTKYYVDAVGYYPISNTYIDLIGTAGLGMTTVEASTSNGNGIVEDDESMLTYRIGAGAQYSLSQRLKAKALVRYEMYSGADVFEDSVGVTVAVDYVF